jgi:hypothetical protein
VHQTFNLKNNIPTRVRIPSGTQMEQELCNLFGFRKIWIQTTKKNGLCLTIFRANDYFIITRQNVSNVTLEVVKDIIEKGLIA